MTLSPDFKPYESKPVTRHAVQITDGHDVTKIGEATYVIGLSDRSLAFKAYEQPKVGDYVVWLKDNDIYHCSEAVFRERNVVED